MPIKNHYDSTKTVILVSVEEEILEKIGLALEPFVKKIDFFQQDRSLETATLFSSPRHLFSSTSLGLFFFFLSKYDEIVAHKLLKHRRNAIQ